MQHPFISLIDSEIPNFGCTLNCMDEKKSKCCKSYKKKGKYCKSCPKK